MNNLLTVMSFHDAFNLLSSVEPNETTFFNTLKVNGDHSCQARFTVRFNFSLFGT